MTTLETALLDALESVRDWAVEAEEGSKYRASILKPQAWEKVRIALEMAKALPVVANESRP